LARRVPDERPPDQVVGELMRTHGDRILRLCFVYLHDLHLAEDALQETFLKAWRGYHTFRGDADPLTWLSRIAINVCKDLHKSAWHRHVNLALSLDSLPEPSTPAIETDDTMIKSVMALPRKLREVVLLVYYTGLEKEEAAKALGISLPTVYRRLNKAQDILKQELEGWHDET
jgi:RNA polymerase sigma-70 factor (ECF subfamily)